MILNWPTILAATTVADEELSLRYPRYSMSQEKAVFDAKRTAGPPAALHCQHQPDTALLANRLSHRSDRFLRWATSFSICPPAFSRSNVSLLFEPSLLSHAAFNIDRVA